MTAFSYNLTGAFTGAGGPVAAGASDTAKTGQVTASATAGVTTFTETATSTTATTNTSATTTFTVTGFNLASANTVTTPINLGNVRMGGTFGTQALSIANTGPAGSFTEGLNANGTASGSASITGSITNLSVAGSPSTAISVGLGNANTATTGLKSGTDALGFASNGAIDGLGNTTLTGQTVTVSGNVYSGQGIYVGSGGNYVNGSNATIQTQWQTGGAPGLDGTASNTDTATFGTQGAGGTVSLNGAAPTLDSITFAGANSYTLAQGTGGAITLGNGGSATIADSSGAHTVSAPITLTSNATLTTGNAGDTLTIAGPINGSGQSVTTSGPGTVIFTGGSGYSGGTTISSGTLEFANASGAALTGNGAIAVNGDSSNTGTASGTEGDLLVASSNQLGTAPTTTNSLSNISLTDGTMTIANSSSQGSSSGRGAGTTASNFGAGALTVSGTNNYLDFGTNNTGEVVAFSSFSLAANSDLYILNYNDGQFDGSHTTQGGGLDQLFFGGNNQTPTTFTNVFFVNPIGANGTTYTGDYQANLLSTGEVVAQEPSGVAQEPRGVATFAFVFSIPVGLIVIRRRQTKAQKAA